MCFNIRANISNTVDTVSRTVSSAIAQGTEIIRDLTQTDKPSSASLAPVDRPATTQRPADKMNKTVSFGNGTAAVSQTANSSNVTASSVLGELRGKTGSAFRTALNEVLKNPEKREVLINHYNLNSPQNKQNLGRAMILEAGTGYNPANMAPVGMVILNRALGTNIASELAGSTKRFTVSNIMTESGQFASKADFNANKRNGEVSNLRVQSTINSLMDGSPQATDNQATAFYFRVGKMKNETFKTTDGHSFSANYDTGRHYMNGNSLKNAR